MPNRTWIIPRTCGIATTGGAPIIRPATTRGPWLHFPALCEGLKTRRFVSGRAYNLGNAAFTQGDAAAAAEYYRQAIRIDPNQADARHNLELALRKLEAQNKEKEEKETSSGKEGEGKESQEEREKGPDKAQEKPSSTDSSKKDRDSKKDADQKGAEDKSEQAKQQEDEGQRSEQGQEQKTDAASPQDLSGELKPREALPESSKEPDGGSASVSSMDRKKAEALLDNVTEDRSKFLQLQMPEGARRGPMSGKDW